MTRGFEHKGYVGVVEYDPEIEMFHGHVVDTKSAITFYGDSVEELWAYVGMASQVPESEMKKN
jgi:predicted HicB family RNase H-like nuclease